MKKSYLKSTISYLQELLQILLGIIAGLLLSEILSDFLIKDAAVDNLLSRSILALVGGFSSDVIFSVLEAIINRLKSIFVTSNNS